MGNGLNAVSNKLTAVQSQLCGIRKGGAQSCRTARTFSLAEVVLGNSLILQISWLSVSSHPSAKLVTSYSQQAQKPARIEEKEETIQLISTWIELPEVTFEPINIVDRNQIRQARAYSDLWVDALIALHLCVSTEICA